MVLLPNCTVLEERKKVLFMAREDEKILEELLRQERSVLELSDQRCRRVLFLLVKKILRENRK